MEKPDGKTVTELADEIGVGRQRVYRYIRSELMIDGRYNNKSVYQVGRVLYVSEDVEKAVKEHFADLDKDKSTINQQTITDLLLSEIDAQEREIERLHKLLDQTHNALDNAQRLQAAAEQRYLQLEQQTEAEKEKAAAAEKAAGTAADPQPETDEKRGIFHRIAEIFRGSGHEEA
jgi:transcriptional regulator with XRE-family HTH domain